MMFHETPDLTMVKFETPKTTITAFKHATRRPKFPSLLFKWIPRHLLHLLPAISPVHFTLVVNSIL